MRTNIVKHWGKHIFMDPVEWVPPKTLRTLGQYEWVSGIMKHEIEGALMFNFLGDNLPCFVDGLFGWLGKQTIPFQ